MNIFQQALIQNISKGCDLSAKEKREMKKMEKLDHQVSKKKPPVKYKSMSVVAKSGPGGVVFDFGPGTGNKMADDYSALLNRHVDQAQVETAKSQNSQFDKALGKYVELGEHGYDNWRKSGNEMPVDKYAGKGTAEIIEDMAKSGELNCDEDIRVKGEFNKSTMNLDGEELVAQSETDAAVIEMSKGMAGAGAEVTGMSNDEINKMLKAP